MSFLFSRNDIVKLIRKNQKTKDGNYFCPFFNSINCLIGNVNDKDYYYNRYIFFNKYYFNEKDIDIYLSKKKKDIDLYDYQKKINKFYEIVKNIKINNLFDKIDGNLYNMADIIDNYEFLYENK